MTTRPSVDQARAYADALVAWAEGKRVEQRSPHFQEWKQFDGVWTTIDQNWEYRVAPAPPKLRVIEVPNFHQCHVGSGCFYAYHDGESPNQPVVKFREVSETADAEMAELRRNHDALAKLADEIISVGREGCLNFWDESHVRAVLNKHGAILK